MSSILYEKPAIFAQDSIKSGHVVIEASAGTGKTYTLEHLVVDLLLNDPECGIENILVVTFTRRATAELRRRVRNILTKVLEHYQNRDTIESCAPEKPHWEITGARARRLRQAVLNFDSAEIFTIHSFCQKLLTENAFQNHQLFDLDLINEKTLFADCYEDILRTKISTNPELKGWFDAWMDPRISGNIDRLGETLKDIHSSSGKLTRSREFPHAFSSPTELLNDVDTTNKSKRKTKKPGWKTDILGHLLAPVVAEMERRKQSEGVYAYADMLTMVQKSLERTGNKNGADGSFLKALRGQYKYALIDEFQDTDPVQWDVFHRIFVESSGPNRLFLIGDPKQAIYKFRGADVWTYLNAVDSISPPPKTPDTPAKRVVLGHNYRSTHSMVRAYNAIFEQTGEPEGDSFFTNPKINYKKPVEPNPVFDYGTRDLQGTHVERAAITAMWINNGEKKQSIVPRWLDWMLAEIESILWGPGQFEIPSDARKSTWRRVDASDIFVLTNSNAESHEIGRMMKARGIPYSFYRQGGLFDSPEALDILAILQGIAHPNRRDKRRAAYRSPFFAVPIRELADFDDSRAGEEARSRLNSLQKIAQNGQFTRLFRKVLDGSGVLLREILLGEGERALTNYQHIFETLGEQAAQGQQSLEELIAWLARKIDGSNTEQDEDLQRLETDRPAIQVMTMHKSKGLEAEVVFIYGGFSSRNSGVTTFIDSDKPSAPDAERVTMVSTSASYLGGKKSAQKTRVTQQSQWASQRLMYVAITRAKSRLYLCHAGPRAKYGRSGRHKALVRSLDRLRENNPVPHDLEFIEIGKVGSHKFAMETSQVAQKAWGAAMAESTRIKPVDFNSNRRQRVRASVRTLTAFSNIKKHDAPRENDVRDESDPQSEANNSIDQTASMPLVDPRFSDDTPMPWGGTEFGSFLHNILEDLRDYSTVLRCNDAEEWLASDAVKRVFDRRGKADRIAAKFHPFSARLLFDTLRTPLALPGFEEPIKIAQIPMKKIAKEIDFHFPMPQQNLDFAAWPADAPTIERGWIKGSIDLTFEHSVGGEARIFIADWKSNYFEDYRPDAVAKELDQKYALQARIYTLAIVRMLGITNAQDYDSKFGGCAYLMLRAMRPEAPIGHGVAIYRPTWAEIGAWERDLLNTPDEWNTPMRVFATPDETRA